MKRRVLGASLALAGLILSHASAGAITATGKVHITATVDAVCTLAGGGGEFLAVANFSNPGTSTISLEPFTRDSVAEINCNVPAIVELKSDNGAATTTGDGTSMAKNFFDYKAAVAIDDGADFTCEFSTITVPTHTGSEFKGCDALLLPAALSDVALTITPVDPGMLIPGTYNDILTLTITAD